MAELVDHEAIHEAVAISTCNRTELYLVTADPVEAETEALGILSRQAGLRPTELLGTIYSLRGAEVVEHLFSVTAGLDSMIVGEAEVQGQVKRSYELALVEGVTGPVSNRLFRDALAAGKRVRSETEISRSNVSVSSVAVQLAADFLGELADRQRGRDRRRRERGAHGPAAVRTRRGGAVRGQPAPASGRSRWPSATAAAPCPSTSSRASSRARTSSWRRPAPHIRSWAARSSSRWPAPRMGRPLALLDLAVPRDIDPGARDCPGIALYDMDDLQQAVARNLSVREAEAEPARAIVREEVARFEDWLASLDVVPTISALRRRGDQIVEQVLRENESAWESLSEADRERLEVMARAVVSRLLHEPTLRLKGSAGDHASYRYVNALHELFGLEAALAPPGAEVTRLLRASPQAGVIRLGTRGSALALAQARWVAERLAADVEIVPITTLGDRRRDAGDKGALRGGDRGGAARRPGRPRRPFREGRARPAARGARDRRGAGARGSARRAVRRGIAGRAGRGRRRRHRQRPAARAAVGAAPGSGGACVTRQRGHASTTAG